MGAPMNDGAASSLPARPRFDKDRLFRTYDAGQRPCRHDAALFFAEINGFDCQPGLRPPASGQSETVNPFKLI
jgi:hypothetical protein